MTEGKKIRGRKRHILVDTEGNLLKVVVHRANMADRDGAAFVLEDVDDEFPRLEKIWADQGYNGELADDISDQYQITLEVVGNPANQKGFVVVPRRWVVGGHLHGSASTAG